jgi:hypothetical protein
MKPRVDVRDLHRLNRHRRQGNLHSLIHCDFLSLGQNWGTAPVVSNAVQQGGQQGGAGGGGDREADMPDVRFGTDCVAVQVLLGST